MKSKIKYDIVALQVELLYQKDFDPHDIAGINNHCDYIRSFIESCGWVIDDFIREMMGFNKISN
jgi:hypothetical protein